MKCRAFRKWASLHLDHQLSPQRQRGVVRHLTDCEPCRLYLRQIRAVSQSLGRLPQPVPPVNLLPATMAAFENLRRASEGDPLARAVNWTLTHSRPVSAVASILITVFCYVMILGQMRPIPYLRAFARPESITLSSSQYNWVNGLVASVPGVQSYSFPRLQQASQIDTPLADMDISQVVVIALVHSDGRASLVEVLEPDSTPRLVQQVETALKSLKFRPAMTGGRAVPTQLVLMMERVDVRGS